MIFIDKCRQKNVLIKDEEEVKNDINIVDEDAYGIINKITKHSVASFHPAQNFAFFFGNSGGLDTFASKETNESVFIKSVCVVLNRIDGKMYDEHGTLMDLAELKFRIDKELDKLSNKQQILQSIEQMKIRHVVLQKNNM